MGKKKKILIGIGAVILCVLNILILCHRGNVGGSYTFHMKVVSDKAQNLQIYYSPTEALTEKMSHAVKYEKAGEAQEISVSIPSNCEWIRFDFGTESAEYEISDAYLAYGDLKEEFLELTDIKSARTQQIVQAAEDKTAVKLTTEGNDPFVWLSMPTEKLYPKLASDYNRNMWIMNILMLLFVDGAAAVALVFRKKIFNLPIELYQNRGLILSLSKNDFKTKYAGSYLGIVWAFVQPVVTILVYWFVFSVGLKAGNMSDYPFVLYLVSGIVPWFFFQDALNGGTNSMIEYNYLVKKVVFKISILPIVKIISAMFVHAFFVAFALILCACYGYFPGLATLQIFYYSACTFMFSLGLVYATSAVVIFFRDLTQIISIILQVGVWLTPIMWDVNMLADYPWVIKLFKLNPLYYIVSGYRDSMLGHIWFVDRWGWTLYFWVVTVLLFGLGSWIFKRLKPHFADIL
jgi:teichoic acid transport system permease protein